MSKQVKTPRFYVDMPTFLHATGQLGWDDIKGGAELLYMNCANPYTSPSDQSSNTFFMIGHPDRNTPKTSFPINFCALLNHNLASDDLPFSIVGKKGLSSNDQTHPRLHANLGQTINVLNVATPTYTDLNPEYNGTSIFTFSDKNGENEYWRSFELYFSTGFTDYTHQLGSLVVGKYWDAPYSPDLNLTMSRSFAGIKKQRTIGGKTLANIYYDGPTEWTMNGPDGTYKYPPFELDLPTTDGGTELGFNMRAKSGLGRKGLKSWKLTFSYIPDDDMWMAYENSSISPFIPDQTGYDATTDTDVPTDNSNSVASNPNPMLSDNSFNFVWNCTLGGTLPFIFQPDKTNNNPDQFAICTFRENTLNVKQNGPNVYQLSVTIDEVA